MSLFEKKKAKKKKSIEELALKQNRKKVKKMKRLLNKIKRRVNKRFYKKYYKGLDGWLRYRDDKRYIESDKEALDEELLERRDRIYPIVLEMLRKKKIDSPELTVAIAGYLDDCKLKVCKFSFENFIDSVHNEPAVLSQLEEIMELNPGSLTVLKAGDRVGDIYITDENSAVVEAERGIDDVERLQPLDENGTLKKDGNETDTVVTTGRRPILDDNDIYFDARDLPPEYAEKLRDHFKYRVENMPNQETQDGDVQENNDVPEDDAIRTVKDDSDFDVPIGQRPDDDNSLYRLTYEFIKQDNIDLAKLRAMREFWKAEAEEKRKLEELSQNTKVYKRTA